ncbi:MAG: NAD(P)/FAD-dependent oxidoreductase [Saprospirales bacterium]|nr:NAD(P)/FAD-dependent oxidoreductase [Saprospirales bacterium]
MMSDYQVLIVGGGNAGISAAAKLLLKNGNLKVGIIEPSEKHYYQPAFSLVGGGTFDINTTVRDEESVIPHKATWIKDAVATFEPEQNTLTCASGKKYTYDYLIVAPGIQLDFDKVKGLKENLGKNGVTSNYTFKTAPYTFECLENFPKGGKAIFTSPNTPVKCGGAPQKSLYLSSDYLRRKGFLKDSDVHFYSGGTIIFGVKKYAETLLKVVARYGIKTHFFHNLTEIDGERKIAYFDKVDTAGKFLERIEQSFDMIHVTPPQSAPDFIKKSPLAVPVVPNTPFFGWVDVNKNTLQHVRYPNIFGLGDASSLPTAKTGAGVRKQMPVLVENLLSLMDGKPMTASYNGYASCPLITGYGKIVMAEFDYDNNPMETFPFDQSKERYSMWLLKKYALPFLYWNMILKGQM